MEYKTRVMKDRYSGRWGVTFYADHCGLITHEYQQWQPALAEALLIERIKAL